METSPTLSLSLGRRTPPPTALTIAGYDPSSGAGVTADLQTFAAHGLFGTSCITALTVQSTRGVRRVEQLPPDLLAETLQCLEEDLPPGGIKIGMLGSAAVVSVVASYLRSVRARRPVYVVVDPVVRSSSGAPLLQENGIAALRDELLPLCDAATPNRSELFHLLARQRGGHGDLLAAARTLQQAIGGRTLVVTGGDEVDPDDLLLDAGREVLWLRATHIDTTATHGTGCAFSSALLSHRLLGEDFAAAASAAKRYVEGALREAPMLGSGRGPLGLLWPRPIARKITAPS